MARVAGLKSEGFGVCWIGIVCIRNVATVVVPS
jgi:hypothetical protein